MVEYETKREWCPLPQPRKYWEVFSYPHEQNPLSTNIPLFKIDYRNLFEIKAFNELLNYEIN